MAWAAEGEPALGMQVGAGWRGVRTDGEHTLDPLLHVIQLAPGRSWVRSLQEAMAEAAGPGAWVLPQVGGSLRADGCGFGEISWLEELQSEQRCV